MDTFAALALATESPNKELLNDRPYKRTDSIMTSSMWRNIIGQTLYQIIVLSILLFVGQGLLDLQGRQVGEKWTYENGEHYTFLFNTISPFEKNPPHRKDTINLLSLSSSVFG